MINPWLKIKESYAYQGWRSILVKSFELPDGQKGDYDIVENAPFVTIAAFTSDRKAILVRQYRPGPERILMSFPEGYIDKGETPEQAAQRELLEETGYRAGTMKVIRVFYSAYSTEKRICLLATDCEKVSDQQLDQDEYLEIEACPLKEFRAFIKTPDDPSFVNVDAAYLALDHLGWL